MPVSINLLPRGNKNLLSGTLQSYLSPTANYMVGDNVPLSTRLPTYILIEPDSTTSRELVKVYDVSGNNIYIKRGLNNSGVGIAHNQGAKYEERMTIEHLNTWVDAFENGWVYDHTDVYTFSQVSTTQFKITGVNRTNIYTAGIIVRFNGSSTARVSSSSYASGDTTVTVSTAVVPTTISTIEIYYNRFFAVEHNTDGTHAAITATSVTSSGAISGTTITASSDIQTSTKVKTDTIEEKTSGSGVSINHKIILPNNTALQQKDSGGTVRDIIKTNSNNALEIGNTNLGIVNRRSIVTATDGATVTFDISKGNIQMVTLGGNRTLAVSNVSVGDVFIIMIKQDGTGSRTVTWWSGISWAGGSTPTLTTTANKTDTFGFICTASNTYQGYVVGQNI